MDEPTIAEATRAVSTAQERLITEYRWQLAEARGHAMVLARRLQESLTREIARDRELEEARRELARKDERIAELEHEAEAAAWRERLGGL